MNKAIRDMQLNLLSEFSKVTKTFALAGGTALELFYLGHRFSRDLDFFSPEYNTKEINNIILILSKHIGTPIVLENVFVVSGKAKVRFYSVKVKSAEYPLKIDFVEDVLFENPQVERYNGVPVYNVKNIYYQKITAITGTRLIIDSIGKEVTTGRKEARDIVDVYYLSKKICPLHIFMKDLSPELKRGIVYWYRSYSRQDLKMDALDLEIYNKQFNVSKMIKYLDEEIRKFISKEV